MAKSIAVEIAEIDTLVEGNIGAVAIVARVPMNFPALITLRRQHENFGAKRPFTVAVIDSLPTHAARSVKVGIINSTNAA